MPRVYLSNTPIPEALELLLSKIEQGCLPKETAPVEKALGRVTAGPVFARLSSPHYHASAMDGIAVDAADTYTAGEKTPVRLQVGEKAFPVDTGDLLPANCNAVIMIEDIHYVTEDTVEIIASVAPWQHVRTIGEDLVATEMVVPGGHILRPMDLGGLLAGGVTGVNVVCRPVVTVIPTGTELVPPGQPVKPGDIIEFNSVMLAGLVDEWGGVAERSAIVADNKQALREALKRALDTSDLVIINAGSSAGREDFTVEIIGELGEVLVHGVAIKPGKPVILGMVEGKPVIGLPGYPVSTYLTAETFVKPLLSKMQGLAVPEGEKLTVSLTRRVMSPPGVDELVRVKMGRVGEKMVATPISRGAGLITTLIRADGILRVPSLVQGYEAGTEVTARLLRPREEIENTTVMVGSHDITLDILGDFLARRRPGRGLSSAHVGSLGGLVALQRGEAHLAGSHLLDEDTGEYNISYIGRYLRGKPVYLVNLTYRDQGLIVPKGNPKNIRSLTDLAGPDVNMVNRQRGAGTRVLFDYELKKLGIEPGIIQGYDREEFTHLGVAAAVAGGAADAGLGILAAARALDLDFIPVAQERYDLVIPGEFWETEYITGIMEILQDAGFAEEIRKLGGYDVKDMGKIMWSSEGTTSEVRAAENPVAGDGVNKITPGDGAGGGIANG